MRTDTGQIVRLRNYKIAAYQVSDVDLTFKLDPHATIVIAQMRVVRGKGVDAGTALKFDGDELKLEGVKINGKPLDEKAYRATPESLTILHPPNTRSFTMETQVVINPGANTKLMGLYRTSGKFCTQCEAEGFRRITYFPDRPDVLAVYTTRIEADRDDAPVLLGNGNLVKKGKLAKNRHYAVWHDPHPKPSYLFALVAGDLGSIHKNFKTASKRKVKLGIYVEHGKEEQAHYAMGALVRSMQWDEKVFGREYDLDVFNIVAVSDFNMGAMENKGLNVFNDKYVLADAATATDTDFAYIEGIIAHEYFHNWTGNRITCRDWFQLCLKEGLTVFRDQEFSSDMRSRSVQRITNVRNLRSSQFAEDAGPLAHPVRPETYREINNFYTATVYQKGSELVRMLATILGKTRFKKGMNLYFRRHDGDAATIEDFLKCFSDASKVNLDQFFNWYSQAGTPSIIATSHYEAKTQKFTLEIEQSLAPTAGQPRKKLLHIPLRFGLVGKDGADMALGSISGCTHDGDILHITKRRHKIVFSNIKAKPVVSLNRNFSAPINLEMQTSNSDLAFLASHDSDPFNRWQAFQTYASKLLVRDARLLARSKAPKTDQKFLEAACAILCDEQLPAAFRALTLTLPAEAELARAFGRSVNPDVIHQARNAMMADIGSAVAPDWERLWKQTHISEDYTPDELQSGQRSFGNLLLDIGVAANLRNAEEASLRQFAKAKNMNERYAAFARIVQRHKSRKASANAIAKFYSKFRGNPLVLDKWFSVQAMVPGAGAVRIVKSLLKHEKFTLDNPNRARSVLASFAFGNPTGFNAPSGEGYKLMRKAIGDLDKSNPQIAARLLTAFRSIAVLESGRRALAMKELRILRKTKSLSKDVSEILDRTLAG